MDMKKMLRDAQKMQEQLQAEIAQIRVEASAGGGVVTAVVTGSKELAELRLDPSVVDPEDIEMLQDLVIAAVSEAMRRVDEEVQSKLGGMVPGGMGALSGLLG